MMIHMRDFSNRFRGVQRLFVFVLVVAVAFTFCAVRAQDDAEPGDAASARRTTTPDLSEVSADQVEMDFNTRVATFTGNVQVDDSRMQLKADKMIVSLNAKNELKKIVAEGNVIIDDVASERRAMGGHTVYTPDNDTMILTEDPILMIDEKTALTGADEIIYDRRQGKMTAKGGRPKIIIIQPQRDMLDQEKTKHAPDKKTKPDETDE